MIQPAVTQTVSDQALSRHCVDATGFGSAMNSDATPPPNTAAPARPTRPATTRPASARGAPALRITSEHDPVSARTSPLSGRADNTEAAGTEVSNTEVERGVRFTLLTVRSRCRHQKSRPPG